MEAAKREEQQHDTTTSTACSLKRRVWKMLKIAEQFPNSFLTPSVSTARKTL